VEVEAALLLVAKPGSPLEALAVVLDEVRIRLDSPDRSVWEDPESLRKQPKDERLGEMGFHVDGNP
jgi:hypothetical protein